MSATTTAGAAANPHDAIKGASDKANNQYVYLVQIKLEGTTESGLCVLSHRKLFPEAELQRMVDEACQITNKQRIAGLRKSMAGNKTPIADPPAVTNARLFRGDVDFLEAVLCDKWEFKKMILTAASGTIEPLIKAPVGPSAPPAPPPPGD